MREELKAIHSGQREQLAIMDEKEWKERDRKRRERGEKEERKKRERETKKGKKEGWARVQLLFYIT